MRSKPAWPAFAGLLFALCCADSRALDPDRSVAQFHHTAWYSRNGAPTDVWAIAQARDGWLWFGGSNGLHRFDGMTFERVATDAKATLRAQAVSSMLALEPGGLAIGYYHGGVSILRDGRFTHYGQAEGLPNETVFGMGQDGDGRLWATTRNGLLHLDGARWRRVGSDWNIPQGTPLDVHGDTGGTLWLSVKGAAKGEVLRLARGSREFQRVVQGVAGGATFIQSPDGRPWYVDEKGAYPLAMEQGAPARLASTNSRISTVALFDRDGSLWSLMMDGLGRTARPEVPGKAARVAFPLQDTSAAGKAIAAEGAKTILEDREGNIWVSTVTGIHRLRNSTIVNETPEQGGMSAGLAAGEKGTIWIVSRGSYLGPSLQDGVWKFDGRLRRVQPREIAWGSAIRRGANGQLWIAGTGSLWRHDGTRFVKALELPHSEEGKIVQCITDDATGALWVSFSGGGLFRHRGSGWQRNGDLAQLPAEGPLAQARDAKGRMWFGYGNGTVVTVDDGQVTTYSAAHGLDLGSVTAIAVGRHTLVTGEHGLAVFRDGRFHVLKTSNAPALQGVKDIVQLGNGDLWLNGSGGAVRVPALGLQGDIGESMAPIAVEVFDASDGYPGSGTQAATFPAPQMALGTDGRVWISAPNGLAWIDPQRIVRNLVPPVVVTASLTAGGERYESTSGVRLSEGTRDLRIDYTALSYAQPERTRFQYRLAGLDDQWVDAGKRRQAFYTNLGPGSYRFEVKAANEHDVWSTQPAAIDFEIPPTFAQTKSFLALCIAAAIALLIFLFRLRVRQVTARERRRLEERMDERERIARELHDTLLQSTQGLILAFQSVANRLPEGDPVRDKLEGTLKRADEVVAEGRERVLDLREPAQALGDLPQALAATGNDLAAGRSVKFRTVVDGTDRELAAVVKDEAYRIGREALLNAFAHSQAAAIEVQVIYADNDFRLRVRDDGRGIDEGTLASGSSPGHWGLVGMRERARKIGAALEIWSRPGAGTEIELRVPASVAYARPRTRWRWPFTIRRPR